MEAAGIDETQVTLRNVHGVLQWQCCSQGLLRLLIESSLLLGNREGE